MIIDYEIKFTNYEPDNHVHEDDGNDYRLGCRKDYCYYGKDWEMPDENNTK